MGRTTLCAAMRAPRRSRAPRFRPTLEILEDRLAPAIAVEPSAFLVDPGTVSTLGAPGQPAGFSPQQISQAYDFNQIAFQNGTIHGDGSGQTIAIVDAYNQPDIRSDVQAFDSTYGLAAPPSFTVVNQNGGSVLPAANTNWGLEISLDVEWAHAMAPGANIVLVEANSNSWSDLLTAVNYARNLPQVSVVSMSWGGSEWSYEGGYNSYFTTPAGHIGITFVASSGDNGSSGAPLFPSVSPNVLSVGGTRLSTDTDGDYSGETGWSGSGGGLSAYESQPSYQWGTVTQNGSQRAVPDVAYNASSNSPYAVYDTSSYGGWIEVYGTSAGAPQWAALVAIADQGRALSGQDTLDGAAQTLPALYQLPRSDFHDITTGNNGAYSAGTGYDLVTGLGTPIANLIVAGLVAVGDTPSNSSPWIIDPASASPSTIAGTTANLSALAGDSSGAAGLTYTWSVLSQPAGVQAPIFTINGSNAAQNTTAIFSAAGSYTFLVTIVDPSGNSITSSVGVTVNQTLTSVAIVPGAVTLGNGMSQQFSAVALDQFGNAISAPASAWTWTLGCAGTDLGNGLFIAPTTGMGSGVFLATFEGMTGAATIVYGPAWNGAPSPGNPADTWSAYWQQMMDAFMSEMSMFESYWQSLLGAWSGW